MLEAFLPDGEEMNANARVQSFCCPTCRGLLGEAAPLEAVEASLTSMPQKCILKSLSRKPGAPVSRQALMSVMFDDRADGGPEFADGVFHMTMLHLRRRLKDFGWMIEGKGGGKGGTAVYRLIPIGGDR